MSRHILAEDEQGYPWIVFPEDIGWQAIKKLPKMGYYALPREALMTGKVTEVKEPFFLTNPIPDELLTAELKTVIVRLDRIYKSSLWLRRENETSEDFSLGH